MITIGNMLLKQDNTPKEAFDLIIDHLAQAQYSESVIPTLADIEEVFSDTVLRNTMKKW